ncbi:RNA polymerase sigma factor [Blastopirellula marina]|uniref:RNA polymerase sigma factor n=1 Tax=Blastopirellula marina TaxID=124 RepID=UPI0013049107|nr:sigma-70 family RNA polymerase sigma factor [Blastopirellula marina]
MSDSPSQQPGRPTGIARELAQLLERYSGPLVLYARQLCSDPEDAVQIAFVKLAQQQPSPRDRAAWLYRVVRNEALMQSRGERRRRDREQVFAETRALWFESDSSASLDGEAAAEALQRLSQSQREIVVARIWGGLAFREIAQLLAISQSSAHREYQQAIETLQKELNEPCPNSTNPQT